MGSELFFQRKQYQKGGIGRWYWEFKENAILKLVRQNHKSIIDIGCGEGITLEKLIARFPDKTIRGLDIVPENIKICRQYNLPAYLGSVYDLNLEDNSVDLCILSEVIEHLEDPATALKNIYKILKTGGDLIVVIPNDRFFKLARLIFLKFKEAFADVGHINKFKPKTIKKIIEAKGFKVVKIKNIPFLFWPVSLHCIVLAKKSPAASFL